MKQTATLTLLLALTVGAGTALAGDRMSDMNMEGMDMGKQKSGDMKNMGGQKAMPSAAHTVVGVVKAIDTKAGKVTIAHEPVKSLNWPAMTMAFKITEQQAAGIKPGQRVNFEFEAKGMDATITKITPVK